MNKRQRKKKLKKELQAKFGNKFKSLDMLLILDRYSQMIIYSIQIKKKEEELKQKFSMVKPEWMNSDTVIPIGDYTA